MTHVAVFVPGIMGSELRLGDQLVWPGRVTDLWLPYFNMEGLLRYDLVATDVIRSYSVSPQYQSLIDDFAAWGFREKGDPPTLYLCPYDWRKSNDLAALTLAELLDAAVRAHGAGAEVSLVAHSMGGLVSRFYLESGAFNDRPGFAAVRRLITLATPHRGAPAALPRVLGQEKTLWLSGAQVQTLAADTRYPAAYQLLPPPGDPFTWDEGAGAEYQPLDPYGPTGDALGLVRDNLEAARAFHGRLDVARRPAHVRYFCFGGTRQTTPALVHVYQEGPARRVRKIEPEGGGDGTVPFWSSTLPGHQSMPTGGEHSVIYRAREIRRTLPVLLGAAVPTAPFFAPAAAAVEVAVRERVVEPGRAVHLALTPVGGVRSLEGELRVERAEPGPGDAGVAYLPLPGRAHPIGYRGLAAETLLLLVPGLADPGLYRLAFYPAGQDVPAGTDELFVQQPPA